MPLIRKNEGITIAVVGVIALFLAERFNAFERFTSFIASHEAYQLDEVVLTLTLGGVAALVIAIRRAIDLRREIAQRVAAEQRAMQLARHDPLTGLPNRRVLKEELGRLLPQKDETGVFLIDLDRFKPVNDVHGHEAGDELLIAVAARLQSLCTEADRVYRLGGDEFVCVVRHDAGADHLARFAGQIIRTLSEPFETAERRIIVGATVGVARFPIDGEEPQDLLRAADIAMYEAKSAGRGGYRFFHAEMDQRFQRRSELEASVRRAVENDEIIPYFQPILDLGSSRIVGFEALARWQHPTCGLIEPDEFLPVIEDMGLLDWLTERILRSGCTTALHWPAHMTLSVNIAPSQLEGGRLPSLVADLLGEIGFPPERLIVEVTENAVITDTGRAASVLAKLQSSGVRTALDDFGKGYSSLSHLRQLRFNHLKIDRSFVRSMPCSESREIVSAVAGLGKALGIRVTAEGVETQQTADALRALGCQQAQGFLFGRPMPAAQAIAIAAAMTWDAG